jgi:heat shock protein HtpX
MFILRWGWLFGDDESPSVLVAVVASFVIWILPFVSMRALSRYREFATDRGAVAITGHPSELASALQRIDTRTEAVPTRDAREHAETNAFFIQPRRSGTIDGCSAPTRAPKPESRDSETFSDHSDLPGIVQHGTWRPVPVRVPWQEVSC